MSHRPRKRFGQNFLVDRQVLARIVAAIAPLRGDHIVEIGPGRGALTLPLLESGARLTAVEIDRDLAVDLRSQLADHDRFELIEADALALDYGALRPQPLRLVGNLPYNISTPLLFSLLGSSASIADMHFMLQREVVDRMVAAPGQGDYGRLSVAVALRCDTQRLVAVAPGAFSPAPKVDSAVVRLVPRSDPDRSWSDAALDQVLRTAFSARRKTLRNALKSLLSDARLSALGIDPALRPEQIEPSAYARIAGELGEFYT